MLRAARECDCRLVFSWANDPLTRRMSISPEEISWEEHETWFHRMLGDENCIFYIVTRLDGEPVGQVRCDIERRGSATISLAIADEWRGHGYATQAIRLATDEVIRSKDVKEIHAYIFPENTLSIRAFRNAGYSTPVQVQHKGRTMLRMSK